MRQRRRRRVTQRAADLGTAPGIFQADLKFSAAIVIKEQWSKQAHLVEAIAARLGNVDTSVQRRARRFTVTAGVHQ